MGLRNVFLIFDVDQQPQVTKGKNIQKQEQIHLLLPNVMLQKDSLVYLTDFPSNFPNLMHLVVAYLIVHKTLSAADINVIHFQSGVQ